MYLKPVRILQSKRPDCTKKHLPLLVPLSYRFLDLTGKTSASGLIHATITINGIIIHPMAHTGYLLDETQRLAILHGLSILDTPPEEEFDRITWLGATLFQVPVCLLGMIDQHRIWFKSKWGTRTNESPRSGAFDEQVLHTGQSLLVCDAAEHEIFSRHPNVLGEPHIRFYASAPVFHKDGAILGTISLMDHSPRKLSQDAQGQLQTLAEIASDTLNLRQSKLLQEHTHKLFADGPVALMSFRFHDRLEVLSASDNLESVLGLSPRLLIQDKQKFEDLLHPEDRPLLDTCIESLRKGLLSTRELNLRITHNRASVHHVFMVLHATYQADGSIYQIQAYLLNTSRQKQLEESLENARQRLKLALDAADLGIWDINLQNHQGVLDQRAASILAISPDEGITGYEKWEDRIHPADHASRKKALDAHLAGQTPVYTCQFRLRRPDNTYIWIESHGRVVSRDAQGSPLRVVGTHSDITRPKREEERRDQQQRILALLTESQQNFLLARDSHKALQSLLDPLMSIVAAQFGFIGEVKWQDRNTPKLNIVAVGNKAQNPLANRLFGAHSMQEPQSFGMEAMDNPALLRVLKRASTLISNDAQTLGVEMLAPEHIPALDSFVALPCLFNDSVLGVIGLGNRPEGFDQEIVALLQPLAQSLGLLMHARDAEIARQKAEMELQRLATLDALTNIPNRRAFLQHCADAMELHKRYGNAFTLGIIDIDHFKSINDAYGHQVGDLALKAVTKTVAAGLRTTDHFGRIGGEEFGLLLPNTNEHDAVMLCERLRQAVETTPARHDHLSFQVRISIGLAQIEPNCRSIEELMSHADRALYRAKENGRNCVLSHQGISRSDLAQYAPELSSPTVVQTPIQNV